MTCNATSSQLTDYVKNELTRPEADAVASHLNGCENCRSQEAEIRKNFGLLRLVPAGRPSDAVWARINAGVDAVVAGQTPVRARKESISAWRYLAVAATLIMAVSAVALFRQSHDQPPGNVARLDRVGPGVTIFRVTGDQRIPMKPGGTLAQGETLVMDPGAAAIFTMEGVGKFRVAGGSTLKISGPRSIDLEKGEIIADITPGGKGFEINAPQARATVLGTLFRVYAADSRTALTVARGTVQFGNEAGKVDVHAGFQSTASSGALPAAPLELAADAADWDLFRSVAAEPKVELVLSEAPAGKAIPFQIVLSSDWPTKVESGVTERTYVILTIEDPKFDGETLHGLASLDRDHRLVLSGELKALDSAGKWKVSAQFASGGREESWSGYSESAVIEVSR
ncbi:MAG: FecR domain-containing protein [Planctomycetes bacterium]|nr:FecR domain-containing protein [Planctomycetota bacterium]